MINPENLPLKYLTSSYLLEEEYPTEEDIIFELLNKNKKKIKLEDLNYNIDKERLNNVLASLSSQHFIEIKDQTIHLLQSPFDE